MPLTDAAIKNAKPKQKAYKLADGEGLYLQVTPTGRRYWRLKYYFGGKEKLLAIGVYPHIGLAKAREKRAAAKKLLAEGHDPSAVKKEEKRARAARVNNSFELVAREWHSKRKPAWSEKHADLILRRLEMDIFPKIGHRPVGDISPPELLEVLRIIEERGAHEVAHRNLQVCGQIFRYAITVDKARRDPAADLRGALTTPQSKHFSSLSYDELPGFLKRLEGYSGDPLTRLGLLLLIHTMTRTTELRAACWSEFNLDKKEWRIPAERMKMKEQHIVPLTTQAIRLIKEIKKLSGDKEHLFPHVSKPGRVMSNNTMLYAIYRMGYKGRTTGHGFRSTASTILNEEGHFRPDVIERQLAHTERNTVRKAYNHAEYLSERRKMMEWWSKYLEKLANQA